MDLKQLLSNIEPQLAPGRYVFCATGAADAPDLPGMKPFAVVREAEGLTLVADKVQAQRAGLPCSGDFRKITLQVHSSLHAVGLTAAVAEGRDAVAFGHQLVTIDAESEVRLLDLIRNLGFTGRLLAPAGSVLREQGTGESQQRQRQPQIASKSLH